MGKHLVVSLSRVRQKSPRGHLLARATIPMAEYRKRQRVMNVSSVAGKLLIEPGAFLEPSTVIKVFKFDHQ